jgi:hypothetical protein
MKSLFKVLLATALMLSVGLLSFAKAVVIVSEISSAEFTSLTTTTPTSWNVKFQAGAISGQFETHEVSMTVGATTTYGQHVWAYPELITLSRGSQGNIYAELGSDIFNVTPTLSFDTILIRVSDVSTPFGDVTFENGIYIVGSNKLSDIPNVSVNESTRYFKMSLGETNPVFDLVGKFDAAMTGTERGFVDFTAVNITPEPSAFMLVILSISMCLFRPRRR